MVNAETYIDVYNIVIKMTIDTGFFRAPYYAKDWRKTIRYLKGEYRVGKKKGVMTP